MKIIISPGLLCGVQHALPVHWCTRVCLWWQRDVTFCFQFHFWNGYWTSLRFCIFMRWSSRHWFVLTDVWGKLDNEAHQWRNLHLQPSHWTTVPQDHSHVRLGWTETSRTGIDLCHCCFPLTTTDVYLLELVLIVVSSAHLLLQVGMLQSYWNMMFAVLMWNLTSNMRAAK